MGVGKAGAGIVCALAFRNHVEHRFAQCGGSAGPPRRMSLKQICSEHVPMSSPPANALSAPRTGVKNASEAGPALRYHPHWLRCCGLRHHPVDVSLGSEISRP
jgi:hypothetical protein